MFTLLKNQKRKYMKIIRKVVIFYINGFKTMPKWARAVWAIILVKLFIMFFILKLFFFPNFLKKNFDSDEERISYVIEQLT